MLLSEEKLLDDPLQQADELWQLARSKDLVDHSHLVISTVDNEGQPSSRFVLIKEIRSDGIVFYSNYASQKSRELLDNPKVSALLYWSELDIQIRFLGLAQKLSPEESNRYFSLRARGSQIGAWASPQSQVLKSRQDLEEKIQHYEKKFADTDVPRPDHWGGFLITTHEVQLLERRDHRLHDSYRYRRQESGKWLRERLAP